MRLHARNIAWLMPLVLTVCLTACDGNQRQAQPQKFAPPVSTVPKPPVAHPQLPETALVLPSEPLDTDTDEILEKAAKPALRRRRPPAKPAPEVSDNSQPQTGATAPPAANDSVEVPAIGELSSGGGAPGAASSDLRRETADSISDTERGLKTIGRSLNGQEQKTAAQIRQFIRQARKALSSGDVDGASTLAAKAKVLLGELNE